MCVSKYFCTYQWHRPGQQLFFVGIEKSNTALTNHCNQLPNAIILILVCGGFSQIWRFDFGPMSIFWLAYRWKTCSQSRNFSCCVWYKLIVACVCITTCTCLYCYEYIYLGDTHLGLNVTCQRILRDKCKPLMYFRPCVNSRISRSHCFAVNGIAGFDHICKISEEALSTVRWLTEVFSTRIHHVSALYPFHER